MVHEDYSRKQIEKVSGAGPASVARWKKQYLEELDGCKPEGRKALMPELKLPSYQGQSVLLVEDNITNQHIVQKLLQGTGLKLDIANNGQEAVFMSDTKLYDIILTDIQMPLMNGYQAAEIILQKKHYENIPIIAITALTLKEDRKKSLANGMSAHIPKPIDPELFYQTLMRWLPPIKKETLQTMDTSNSLWPFNEPPGFDITVGLKNFLGDQELYQKVLIHFYEDHMYDTKSIKQCLKNNDKEKAKRVIHTIKGAASTLGAKKLNQAAVHLEEELKNNKTQDLCLHEFQFLLDEVLSGIASLEKQFNHNEETVQNGQKINKTLLPTIIQELSEKLLQASPLAIELVPQLTLALGKENKETAEELQEMIDAFDFDKALIKLKQIKKEMV
jgi:CheY-like chemotaxis protein